MNGSETKQLQGYTVDDIAEVFSETEIIEIDAYQRLQAESTRDLLQDPVHPYIGQQHRKNLHLLTHNTARFDDEIRAIIAEDPVIKAIEGARYGKGYTAETITAAKRARRAVIAYLAIKSSPE